MLAYYGLWSSVSEIIFDYNWFLYVAKNVPLYWAFEKKKYFVCLYLLFHKLLSTLEQLDKKLVCVFIHTLIWTNLNINITRYCWYIYYTDLILNFWIVLVFVYIFIVLLFGFIERNFQDFTENNNYAQSC